MLEKKFQKTLQCGITVSILITSHTSETPCIKKLEETNNY